MIHTRQGHAAPYLAARWLRVFIVVSVLCISAAGCARGEPRPHEPLTAGAEPLRSAFNSDLGKPRIVIIAAPT